MTLERSDKTRRASAATLPLALVATLLVAGCATTPAQLQLPEPVRAPSAEAPLPAGEVIVAEAGGQRATTLVQTPTPAPPRSDAAASGVSAGDNLPPMRGDPINANIEAMPVPAFINEFFGTILGVGIQMDPAVARMTDLVTLRTPGPQSPPEFYRLAVRVLETYGVATSYDGGRVVFSPAARGGAFEPPLVLSGRALPSVPITHRPVFRLVPLQAVRIGDALRWLNTAFASEDLDIIEDLNRNAIVLYGKPDLVAQAAAAIDVFDRPYMRGRLSTRLEPAFIGAAELAQRLVEVLGAEGYGAALFGGQGGTPQGASIVVLPIPSGNTVLLFAADRALIDHAVDWARTIDQPNPTAGASGLFYYTVRNTSAEEIVQTLNGVRSAAASTVRTPPRETLTSAEASLATQAAAETVATPIAGGDITAGQVVLDAPRNAIIFQGSSSDWARLLPLIQQMDQAARQVMIEVTIAEVTLIDDQQFGVNWLLHDGAGGRYNGTITSGVLEGAGVGSSGLTYLVDVAGQARARLQALAEDSRVSVLSTPRLLVKSGEEASIDVGTEVPIISAQTASNQQTDGNTNILQSVQYRKTGMILDIKPIVYSDNRIDLEIRQEVSNALPLSADAAVPSPAIFNRAVSTHLSMRDGSSVIIGGLMSRDVSDTDAGVPYLKDIPVLGGLFETKGRRDEKRELVIMIVPYIVENDAQARGLTRSLELRHDLLDLPASTGLDPGAAPATPAPPLVD